APAIFTPQLVQHLGLLLIEAEKTVENLRELGRHLSHNEALYLERLRFVRLGYETLKSYIAMVEAAAKNVDYRKAVAVGEEGLRARDGLTQMNKAFTSTKFEKGYAFWPGEVEQYRELNSFVNGEKGRLLVKLPLEWSFHRDPDGTGMTKGLLDHPVDLGFWRAHGGEYDLDRRKDYPVDQWEIIRTDLYIQAQGIRTPDRESAIGDIWYRTEVVLPPGDAESNPHIRFPGLFNECELFVNGKETAKRRQHPLWWHNDYRFEWDVPLRDRLHSGLN
ncbi:HAD family hydrolase, partial [Methylocystis suflitae]|uniref:hypothetical protein n=1 Tax=Methylocystis suflitae TaxID=2951405 RepID=UPI002108ED3C